MIALSCIFDLTEKLCFVVNAQWTGTFGCKLVTPGPLLSWSLSTITTPDQKRCGGTIRGSKF